MMCSDNTIDSVLGWALISQLALRVTILYSRKTNLIYSKHFSLYNRMESLWTISTPISPEILFRIEMCLVSS